MTRVSNAKPCKVVYSLLQHEYLGFLLESYIVQLNPLGDFSLSYNKIYSHTAKEFEAYLDETDFKIISLLEECEQEHIIRKFYKKPERPAVFFPKYYDDKMHLVVRPYIEKRLLQAIALMVDKPIFEMGKEGNPAWKKIKVAADPASVLFHFRRTEESTRYFPTIKYQEKRIEFMFKDAQIICNSPAWMLLEGTLHYFEEGVEGKKLQPFLNKRFIEIPRNAEPTYYQKFITTLIEKHHVYAEGFDIITEKYEAKPILKVSEMWNKQLQLVLYFKYGEYVFPYRSGNKVSVTLERKGDNYVFHRVKRSLQWEADKVQELCDLGLQLEDGAAFSIAASQKEEEQADVEKLYSIFEWLGERQEDLQAKGFALEQNEGEKKYLIGNSRISIDFKENSDWFDVHAVVYFGPYEVPFLELRNHILNKIREFVLPNGEIAIIPEVWFSQYSNLFSFSESGSEFRLKKMHIGLVKDYTNDNLATLTMDRKLEQLSDFEEIEDVSIADAFQGELRPYQKAGYNWFYFLRKYNFGGCLADDMGLGKTIQTLALLQKIKEEHRQKAEEILQLDDKNFKDVSFKVEPLTSLIVMPTSLIHNWLSEAGKFTPGLRIFVYTGTDRIKDMAPFAQYDIVLTTYGIVRLDKDLLKDFYFHYIILDESQIIKNQSSKIAKAVKTLKCKYRLILSGTPIENSIEDLWSQMQFINPGLLGNHTFFMDEFATPIEKKKDQDKADKLQALIKPFVLRRTKKQVASELPEKTEHVYYSHMSEEQEKVYEETKSYYRNEILKMLTEQGMAKSQIHLLQGLTKLRQIANHPLLVDDQYEDESGKFSDVLMTLETILEKKHKVLIFSQFVKHLSIFRKQFDAQGIKYSYLDGQTHNREEVVNEFRKDENIQVFLISIKAGGVGLNLTEADYVFILDPWWNPAVEQQAIDRTHRIGQTKNVFIYKFITKNSVEEKILALQERKRFLAETFISIEESFVKSLTEEDIRAILE